MVYKAMRIIIAAKKVMLNFGLIVNVHVT